MSWFKHKAKEQPGPAPASCTKSLSDIFNSFTQDAVKRFPGLGGRLVILDINELKVHVDPRAINPQSAVTYMQNHPYFRQMQRSPETTSSASMFDPRNQLAAIFINDRFDKSEFNNVSEAAEKRLLYVLDHELAHQAIIDGNYGMHGTNGNDYNTLVGECIADAYALIRHYQRFGTAGETSDKYVDPASRALHMIMRGDMGHFTSFVLDEIQKQKDKIDFNKLDNEQTAELARRFALKYMPSAPVVESLFNTFAPLRRARTDAEAVMTLVNITLSPQADYFTFKLGNIWLKDILRDEAFIKKLNMPAGYRTDVTRQLKEKEFKHTQEDVLFNLPGARKPPAKPAAANQNTLVLRQFKI